MLQINKQYDVIIKCLLDPSDRHYEQTIFIVYLIQQQQMDFLEFTECTISASV